MEQVTGIEPASSAWKADVLPLDDTCKEEPIRQTAFTALPALLVAAPRDFHPYILLDWFYGDSGRI